jgi:hypothetical protein
MQFGVPGTSQAASSVGPLRDCVVLTGVPIDVEVGLDTIIDGTADGLSGSVRAFDVSVNASTIMAGGLPGFLRPAWQGDYPSLATGNLYVSLYIQPDY